MRSAYAAWHALASAASLVQRVLERAQAALAAIALEPGDCAWERAVLGAAGMTDSEGRAR